MWALIIPLLSGIFGENGPLGQYLKVKAAKQQADADLALQVQKDKMQLSAVIAQAAVDSENNKLQATSQTFKAFSYTILTLPVVIVCVFPDWGKDIFENLSIIPVWYAQLYVAIVGVIWGLPIAASAVGGIFSAVQQAWDIRNQGKIDKIQAIGKANGLNTEQAKKEIFDVLKAAVNLNGYTQAQVDTIGPVLDKYLADKDK